MIVNPGKFHFMCVGKNAKKLKKMEKKIKITFMTKI